MGEIRAVQRLEFPTFAGISVGSQLPGTEIYNKRHIP
jgi:hypothetical protein